MFDKYKLQSSSRKRKLSFPYHLGDYEHIVSFDFVTATPLETCVSRVAAMQDLRELDPWSPQTRVHIQADGTDTYAFIIREREPAPIELRGYMNRLDDGTTYVSGEASAKLYLQAAEVASLLALIVLLTWFVGLFVAILFLPPLGVFGWFYWRGARKERDRVVAVLRDTLGVQR
jgi:hypothetical protein